jgi:uncharacterized membrane protein
MRELLETLVTRSRTDCIDTPGPHKAVIVACSAALLTLLPVAGHQLGCLDHLPDPPTRIFASERITESEAAHPLGIPDSLLGLGSYGVTLALALNAARRPWVRKALAVKLLVDGLVASFNVIRQVVSFRRLCSWCTGTALCTAAMLVSERATIRRQISIMRQRV